MKEIKEYSFGYILLKLLIVLPVGILLSFYKAFIIQKVIEWFNIPIHLSIIQLYGLLLIYNFIVLSFDKLKEEKEIESILDSIIGLIKYAIVLSLALGLSYLIYLIVR